MAHSQKASLSAKVPQWVTIITALTIASAGIFIILGLAFMGVGLWLYQDTQRFVQNARSVQGTVVELVRSSSQDRDGSRSSNALCPVIEFTDHQGDITTFQLNMCSYPPRYRRGEPVTVLYAPDNPYHAQLNDKSTYLPSYIFSGIGALSSVIGFSLLMIIFFVRKWLAQKYKTAKVS